MPEQNEAKIFEIGLAMAGAVSAGAYSAGVLDFLLQALAEWEKARAAGEAVPNHRVVIKVVAGASAGAITGALGAVAMAGGLKLEGGGPGPQGVLPSLYDTWVVLPEMVATSGDIDLLSGQDLQGGRDVVSVLNSDLLDRIRDKALTVASQGPALPFVAKDFHVYMSVANLRGVPYVVKFSGGSYGMQSHGDRAHYIVRGLGLADTPSAWAGADDFIPLDIKDLVGKPSDDWRAYGDAALASGAFPLGLAPREIHASTRNYDDRRWPIDVPQITEVKPGWPLPWGAKLPRTFNYLNVDGGLINNEPFEYARFALMKDPPKGNERAGDKVDRAVLMIDPFPEPPDFLPDNKPDRNLVSLVMTLFPTLKNQARFKPSELVLAADETIFSRFLIAPHRQLSGKPREELYAIACGLLGGFLDRAFRDHDFQLGRRNCQRFLRESFALPGGNPLIQAWPDLVKQNPAFRPATPPLPGEPAYYDIIPLVGSATREVTLPPWPRMNPVSFEMLQTRIRQRLETVAPALIRKQAKSRKVRAAMKFALWIGKDKILDYVRYAVLSDLIRRDQLAGWDLPPLPAGVGPDEARKVIAELANPSFDFRTEKGVAETTSLDPALVSTVIAFLLEQKGKPYEAWRSDRTDESGAPSYTLVARKPSWVWRLPGVSALGEWLAAPAIG
jgi:hypothetical protein